MPPFLFKLIIVLLLLFILVNLARALIHMVKQNPDPNVRMSRFLGRRVALSAAAILFLILALKLGWIVPNVRPY